MSMFKVGDIIKSSLSLTLNYKTATGVSKKPDWLAAGVPCIIKEKDNDNLYVDLFTSCRTQLNIIDEQNSKNFVKCEIESDYIIDLDMYPNDKIHLSEFEKRQDVKVFMKKIRDFAKPLDEQHILKRILKDKLSQIEATQGADNMTIDKINSIDIDLLRLEKTKRYDNMIFNRCTRWNPPISDKYTYEEYKNSVNFCRPIGTRPKDFCLPSEFIATCQEMIRQIACFKGIDDISKNKLIEIASIENHKCNEFHRCKWSGEIIDASQYSSGYSSKNNFIEICHRDPNDRFLAHNMYWGLGESNRQQGGYSELERIEQIVRLAKSHPSHLEYLKVLLEKEN